MARDIEQIFTDNPATTMELTDLVYLGRSPFDVLDDFAITFDDFQKSITDLGILNSLDVAGIATAYNFVPGFLTQATAGGTTTLLATSVYMQWFTGTMNEDIVMPVTSTLIQGQGNLLANKSSGILTIKSSGGNTILEMAPNSFAEMICILTSGTTETSWNFIYDSNDIGVSSLTGTPDQISFSSPTGDVIASLPQDIAPTSDVTFNSLVLTGTPLDPASGGTGIDNGSSTINIDGPIVFNGAFSFEATLTGNTNITFPLAGVLTAINGSVTDNHVPRWDGTTGALQDSGVIIDDSNNISGIVDLTLTGDITMSTTEGIMDDSGNLYLQFLKTGSSDSYLTITNGGGGLSPIFGVDSGSLTDVGIGFQMKGNANYSFLGTSVRQSLIQLWEQTTNGTDKVGLQPPASVTTGYNITMPGAPPGVSGQVATTSTAGVQSWSGSAIAATNGVSFGAGSGTLNYYDQRQAGTAPTITFTTPGDLSVAYTSQTLSFTKIGDLVFLEVVFNFTPTYTTSAGTLVINGMPFSANGTAKGIFNPDGNSIPYPASRTTIICGINNATNTMILQGYGASAAVTGLGVTQFPSGVATAFRCQIVYFV